MFKENPKTHNAYVYKTYNIRGRLQNFFTKKTEEDFKVKSIDLVTQEKINKIVAKKFEMFTEKEDYFRHYEPADPANFSKKFQDKYLKSLIKAHTKQRLLFTQFYKNREMHSKSSILLKV